MPDIFITIVGFVVLIGVLVFIHELGHFLAARWTGMRAEVFAVGMGPRLFGWNRLNGFTFGKLSEEIELGENTDYRISALPIGGYVKILGMVDESMDTDFAESEPQPWEFRSKNTWQKAFVLSAGVIMNFLLAIVLFAGLKFFNGDEFWATTTVGSLSNDHAQYVAKDAGFQEGDKIVSINGDPVKFWEEVNEDIYVRKAGEDLSFLVERDGSTTTIEIPRSEVPNVQEEGRMLIPADVGLAIAKVVGTSPAHDAGVADGDTILAMDGGEIGSYENFTTYLEEHKHRKIAFTLKRGEQELTLGVQPDDEGKLGVQIVPVYRGPTERVTYAFFPAIAKGFGQVADNISLIVNLIGDLFAGKQKLQDSVGGPVMIFEAAGQSFINGPAAFLGLMAYLSVMLAFLNILPIPALDGGHLVFVFIEGIMRREVPLKVRLAAQQVGFLLLLVFMVFVFYNDLTRL